MESKKRCEWVTLSDPLYLEYHDNEWGTIEHSDKKLFESLIFQGFQAGLSWKTILYKRKNFIIAYDYFDPVKISQFNNQKVNELLQNRGIIKNKLKIIASVENAKAFLKIQKELEIIVANRTYRLSNNWYENYEDKAFENASSVHTWEVALVIGTLPHDFPVCLLPLVIQAQVVSR